MDVTSNHLEVVPSDPRGGFGADPMEQPDNGEELTKRSEHFGHPVGKRMQCRALIFRILTDAVDDSSSPPVLICKIRKGQELKVTCIAKKVRIVTQIQVQYS
jgi:DNA-directed RNA polymerase II subunit RPB3